MVQVPAEEYHIIPIVCCSYVSSSLVASVLGI